MKFRYSFLLLSAVLLASCGGTGSELPAVPADTEQTEAAAAETAEAPRLDSLPQDLDFGGAAVMIYDDKDLPIKDYHAEETGDIVDDALFARNRAVEERLNITLDFFDSEGAYEKREVFAGGIRQSVMANEGAYDIAAGYSLSTASLASGGYLANLVNTEYLDFSMPWWSDSLIDCLCVQNHLYFVSGDISTNTLGGSFCVFFNKSMQQTYDVGDPYALVDAGKWTLDALLSMAKGIYEDVNANGKKDKEDRFGLSANSTSFDNLYFSCGMNMIDHLPDGSAAVSADWNGERAVSLIGILCDAFHNGTDAYFSDESEGSAKENFLNGNSVFMLAGLSLAATTLRDADFDYGIVPAPKWDEEQEQYHTVAAYTNGMYCIPADAKDLSLSSAVMEAMAMESYYTLAPAFFETAMKVKYTSDNDSARMFDIIKGSVMYDFGRMFSQSALDSIPGAFRNAVVSNQSNWTSACEKTLPKFEKLLSELTETLVSFD